MADKDDRDEESTQDSADSADSKTTETDESTDDASGGDTTASEKSDKEPSVPKARFDEVNNRMKQAEESVDDLKEQMDTLAKIQESGTKKDQKSVVDKLKAQGYDAEQIELLKEMAKEFGGVSTTQEKVEKLEAKLAQKEDSAALKESIAKYKQEGVEISEEEVTKQVAEWYKKGDPKFNLDYDDVIHLMKKDEIMEKEVNASIEGKTSTPKVSTSKTSGAHEPEPNRFVYNPSDPMGSMESLQQEVEKRLNETEE